MTDEVHADHEVDRVSVRAHELLRAHRAGHEVRRLLAVERRDDHTAAGVLVAERTRDLDEYGDRSGVVVGAPEHIATDLAEVIEVRPDEHVAIDVTADSREHV